MFGIMVVDDEREIVEGLSSALKKEERAIFKAYSLSEANLILEEEDVDLIISDNILPDGNGIEFLKKVKRQYPDTIFILMTGYSTVDSAVESLKAGAYDYIIKPIKLEEIRHIVDRVYTETEILKENEKLKEEIVLLKGYENVVSKSKAMQEIFSVIERIKDIDATVLITGESGSGKEVIARTIHERSKRHKGPFVAINCGAIPETLIEDELFGHVKGAFTDAVAARIGAFEKANGGVLFLDEISALRLDLQVKLLRVLQEREFTPIGTNNIRKVDARVIAASNVNLKDLVKEGKFREDLYYRLNIINIEIPPLRERKEDILPLINFMISKISRKLQMPQKTFSKEALEALIRYDYPGNVRELENIVERAMALSQSDKFVEIYDLPKELREEISGEEFVKLNRDATDAFIESIGLEAYLRRIERGIIVRALKENNWRKSKTATKLKIQRTTLVEKMKRLSIPLKNDLNNEKAE